MAIGVQQHSLRPASIRTAATRASGCDWWWTEARLAKLRYVMEKYNDVGKAARVLGCSPGHASYRWIGMQRAAK